MSQGDWREQWDAHASGESKKYLEMPLDELVNKFRTGKLGDYQTIWNVIGKRAAFQDIGWELYDFLRSDHEYLDRYHCADTLLKLMQSDAFTPVELSAKHGDNLEKNLRELETLLEQKIGPRR
jgi:hypothetical protein